MFSHKEILKIVLDCGAIAPKADFSQRGRPLRKGRLELSPSARIRDLELHAEAASGAAAAEISGLSVVLGLDAGGRGQQILGIDQGFPVAPKIPEAGITVAGLGVQMQPARAGYGPVQAKVQVANEAFALIQTVVLVVNAERIFRPVLFYGRVAKTGEGAHGNAQPMVGPGQLIARSQQ